MPFSPTSGAALGGIQGIHKYLFFPAMKKNIFCFGNQFKTFLSIDFKSNIHLNSIHLNNFWASFQRQRNIYSVIHSNDVMIAVVKKF